LLLPRLSVLEGLDVLHSPNDTAPLGRVRTAAVVVTIHDVNFYSLSDRLPNLAGRLFESWVRRSARRADEIITVSEFSRKEISRRLGTPSCHISVVHNAPAMWKSEPGARWSKLASRLGITGEYLITFADGSPHKNLPNLLRAFARLANGRRLQLVVVGRRERQNGNVRGALGELKLEESVVFTDHLDDCDLSLVFANARLLAFPSLYEGFGLPVVEAMAAGIPVACSRTAALPEIADGAAAFFSPSDISDMTLTIGNVMTSEPLREGLVAAGRRRVKQFSWEHAAMQTVEVYERAARSRGREIQ
jgi:glycosyltransferase involved in cell wall biosynthesis